MALENEKKTLTNLGLNHYFYSIDEFFIFIAIFCIKAVKIVCIIFYNVALINSTPCERPWIKIVIMYWTK